MLSLVSNDILVLWQQFLTHLIDPKAISFLAELDPITLQTISFHFLVVTKKAQFHFEALGLSLKYFQRKVKLT